MTARREQGQEQGQGKEQEQQRNVLGSSPAPAADMEEISLREILEVLLQRKGFIALVVVLFVAASFFFTRFAQTTPYASATVEMRFPEMEQNTYPSGQHFSSSDLISTSILSRVVADLGLGDVGLSSGALREILAVEPLMAPDDEGELTVPLYQYRLTVGAHADLTPPQQRRILSSLVEHYRKVKAEEFIEMPMFPRFSQEQEALLALDYPFVLTSLLSYLELMTEFAGEMEEHAEQFRSPRHGLSFKDFSRSLALLQETQFRDLSSLVAEHGLTRERELTLMRYRGMLQELDREEQSLDRQSRYARELLGEAGGLRQAALPVEFPLDFPVPLAGEEGEVEETEIFQFLFEENFFRYLLDVSVETGVSAIDTKTRMERLQKEIRRLEEGAQQTLDQEELYALADARLTDFAAQLDNYADTLNQMMLEYYEGRPREMIAYAVPPYQHLERGNLQLNLAVAGVLGLMLGVFVAFFQHYWQSTGKSEEDD